MNDDEKIVLAYLQDHYGQNIVLEPEPNSTPDFLINVILQTVEIAESLPKLKFE